MGVAGNRGGAGGARNVARAQRAPKAWTPSPAQLKAARAQRAGYVSQGQAVKHAAAQQRRAVVHGLPATATKIPRAPKLSPAQIAVRNRAQVVSQEKAVAKAAHSQRRAEYQDLSTSQRRARVAAAQRDRAAGRKISPRQKAALEVHHERHAGDVASVKRIGMTERAAVRLGTQKRAEFVSQGQAVAKVAADQEKKATVKVGSTKVPKILTETDPQKLKAAGFVPDKASKLFQIPEKALINAPKDAGELAITTPTTLAKIGVDQAKAVGESVKKGSLKPIAKAEGKLGKELAQPYVDAYHDPIKAITEHPVSTALMFAPTVKIPGRVVGKAARVGAFGKAAKAAQSLERPPAHLPGTTLREPRVGSRNAGRRYLQHREDIGKPPIRKVVKRAATLKKTSEQLGRPVAKKVPAAAHPAQVAFEKDFAVARAGKHGISLTKYKPHERATHTLIHHKDGGAGAAVTPDGEIVSVFRNPNAKAGTGSEVLKDAIAHGGKTLDAFGDDLRAYYEAHGFKVTGTAPFDIKQAPKGWDVKVHKTPSVHFMEYAGAQHGRPTTPDLAAVSGQAHRAERVGGVPADVAGADRAAGGVGREVPGGRGEPVAPHGSKVSTPQSRTPPVEPKGKPGEGPVLSVQPGRTAGPVQVGSKLERRVDEHVERSRHRDQHALQSVEKRLNEQYADLPKAQRGPVVAQELEKARAGFPHENAANFVREFGSHYQVHHAPDRPPMVIKPKGATQGHIFTSQADAQRVADSLGSHFQVVDAGYEKYGVVPRVAQARRVTHPKIGKSQAVTAKMLRTGSHGLRTAQLSTSLKWGSGQVLEPAVRAAVEGAGPVDWWRTGKVLRRRHELDTGEKLPRGRLGTRPLKNLPSGAARDFAHSTIRGGMYDETSIARHGLSNAPTLAEDYAGTWLAPSARAATKLGSIPGIRHGRRGFKAYSNFVFNHLNDFIERNAQRAMAGHHMKHELLDHRVLTSTNAAIDEVARGIHKPATVARAGREVRRMFGNYSVYSPDMRENLAHNTPFLPWYLNMVKFLTYNLPHKHPLKTALLADANQADLDWRKAHGVSFYSKDNKVPSWMMGSYPTASGGHVAIGHYTPFSPPSPLAAAGQLVWPQFTSTLAAAGGRDWKGDAVKGSSAINTPLTAAESLVPLVGKAGAITGVSDKLRGKKDAKTVFEKGGPSVGSQALKQVPFTSIPGQKKKTGAKKKKAASGGVGGYPGARSGGSGSGGAGAYPG